MAMISQTKEGKQKVDVFYVNSPIPCVVEENFEGHFPEHDDFALAEVLQDQESLYQSLQRNAQTDMAKVASHAETSPNHDHVQNKKEGNSSVSETVESQLAKDEALARELQELENQLAGTSLGENTGTDADKDVTTLQSTRANGEGNSSNTPTQVARQDDIDPDYMSYEELQSLSEDIGTASRGLSDELISFLPSSTYKTGLFSKKEKHEECVICSMPYKNRDKLITLPCQHQYHNICITRWLKIKKTLSVLKKDSPPHEDPATVDFGERGGMGMIRCMQPYPCIRRG